MNDRTSLHLGWGIYYQAPNFVSLFERFERSIEWNLFETSSLGTEKAQHNLVGIEFQPSPEFLIKGEGYYKELKDLVIQQDSSANFVPDNSGSGHAYGTELIFRRRETPKTRLSGWLSYSSGVTKGKGLEPYYYFREGLTNIIPFLWLGAII